MTPRDIHDTIDLAIVDLPGIKVIAQIASKKIPHGFWFNVLAGFAKGLVFLCQLVLRNRIGLDSSDAKTGWNLIPLKEIY